VRVTLSHLPQFQILSKLRIAHAQCEITPRLLDKPREQVSLACLPNSTPSFDTAVLPSGYSCLSPARNPTRRPDREKRYNRGLQPRDRDSGAKMPSMPSPCWTLPHQPRTSRFRPRGSRKSAYSQQSHAGHISATLVLGRYGVCSPAIVSRRRGQCPRPTTSPTRGPRRDGAPES